MAAQLISAIENEVGVAIPLRSLFESPTVNEIAMLIAQKQNGGGKYDIEPHPTTPTRTLSAEEVRRNLDSLLGEFDE